MTQNRQLLGSDDLYVEIASLLSPVVNGIHDLSHLIASYAVPSFRPLYMYQWLDVCDSDGIWCEAQVIWRIPSMPYVDMPQAIMSSPQTIQIILDLSAVHIHCTGWQSKYDEVLDLRPGSKDSQRYVLFLFLPSIYHPWFVYDLCDLISTYQRCSVAVLHTHTSHPSSLHSFNFVRDQKIQCFDTTNRLLKAVVLYIRYIPEHHQTQFLVHYIGWDHRYDEWVNSNSYRLRLWFVYKL